MRLRDLPQEEFEYKDKSKRMRSVYLGKYWVWRENGVYRWALKNWPDDGFGDQNHGAARTLWETLKKCREHFFSKEELGK